jgi:hypothetical protein
MSDLWTQEEEAARLAERFVGVNQAQFARTHLVPGGASMLSQHIKGRRPMTMEAAVAYARGFGVPLDSISPRLALQAREASLVTSTERIAKAKDVPTVPSAEEVVARLADMLDAMGDAERERVAQRLLTLAQAPDSRRAREALVAAFTAHEEVQKPLGAPIAPEHLAELEKLAEEAEKQHGKTGQQRRRTSRR